MRPNMIPPPSRSPWEQARLHASRKHFQINCLHASKNATLRRDGIANSPHHPPGRPKQTRLLIVANQAARRFCAGGEKELACHSGASGGENGGAPRAAERLARPRPANREVPNAHHHGLLPGPVPPCVRTRRTGLTVVEYEAITLIAQGGPRRPSESARARPRIAAAAARAGPRLLDAGRERGLPPDEREALPTGARLAGNRKGG